MTSLKKGHYFTVHISYFETKIHKNKNISIQAPLSDAHIVIYFNLFRKVFLTQIHVTQIESL